MFYKCKQIEGGERLLNLDCVQYLAPIQYQGGPATLVKMADEKSLQIYGSLDDHCAALADQHTGFFIEAPRTQVDHKPSGM